ncbi:MAG: hypothetical protein M1830_008480 [Pleopsidium flavum]|nr:MAG: hypothetical protein M1830_008480 [Pleopsidium flavum]
MQESYYNKIVERYMKFCASTGGNSLDKVFASLTLSGTVNGSVPPNGVKEDLQASTTDTSVELAIIMMAMRKLREAIFASRRTDAFAQRAYIFIVRAAILTKHMESYHPAILYLLNGIHSLQPLPDPELHEFVGYYILDLACRQGDYAGAYAVRSQYEYRDRRVEMVLGALVHDNWCVFWRMRRAVDGYQKRLMEWAEDGLRVHALKCLGRTYLTVEKGYVERVAERAWEELRKENGVGWELEGEKIVVRRAKGK